MVLVVKNLPANTRDIRDTGLIPGLGELQVPYTQVILRGGRGGGQWDTGDPWGLGRRAVGHR